jgi:hypothetical protein
MRSSAATTQDRHTSYSSSMVVLSKALRSDRWRLWIGINIYSILLLYSTSSAHARELTVTGMIDETVK